MIKGKEQLLAGSRGQVNETKNSYNCHTGRGEVVIRYPVWFVFFLDSGHPQPADSGMTGSVAPSKSSTFQLPAIHSTLIIGTINLDKSFCLILLTDYAHFTASPALRVFASARACLVHPDSYSTTLV